MTAWVLLTLTDEAHGLSIGYEDSRGRWMRPVRVRPSGAPQRSARVTIPEQADPDGGLEPSVLSVSWPVRATRLLHEVAARPSVVRPAMFEQEATLTRAGRAGEKVFLTVLAGRAPSRSAAAAGDRPERRAVHGRGGDPGRSTSASRIAVRNRRGTPRAAGMPPSGLCGLGPFGHDGQTARSWPCWGRPRSCRLSKHPGDPQRDRDRAGRPAGDRCHRRRRPPARYGWPGAGHSPTPLRLIAVVGLGASLRVIARVLLPRVNAAAGASPLTEAQLTHALYIYKTPRRLPSGTAVPQITWQVGQHLTLPVEVGPAGNLGD